MRIYRENKIVMKIFGLITVHHMTTTNAAVVRRQAGFNRIFNGDYSNFSMEDLSTTEDFDESLLFLETTPQPFDIFSQTTGPLIDEFQFFTSGPDYIDTTPVPFGAFTTEENFNLGDFLTTGAALEIDLSTVMTFPTDAPPSIFTTGPIFGNDFTTIPDFVTLGVTGAPETIGLPPIPETTEFVPFGTETTASPMIMDFTTPFQLSPTVPEWLFKTTASFGLPEITEEFTGLPFLTTPQPNINSMKNPTEQPKVEEPNPDSFDQDAFTNAIENAIKALENNNNQPIETDETDETDKNPIIDDNSVAVLIPVPNKSTTSSPVTTSTSTRTTTTAAGVPTTSSTSSSTTRISTTLNTSTIRITTTNSSTATKTPTTTSTSSLSPLDTTAVVETFPLTTAENDSMITNSLIPETEVSSFDIDVTTPADLVVDLTTGDIDVTETTGVSNDTTQAAKTTSTTPSAPTTAVAGFSVTGLAITALIVILL